MPFDLASAKPADSGGFDLASAKPVDGPKAAPRRIDEDADPTSIGNLAGAATEPLMAMGTGAAGSVAGGLSGLAGAALPGPPWQGADWSRKVSDALTYSPKTTGGKNAMKVIG